MGRLLVVGAAALLAGSTLSGGWVTTMVSVGGEDSLRVFGDATPWDGFFLPLLLVPLASSVASAVLAALLLARTDLAHRLPERKLYLALGLLGAGAVAIALWIGPVDSYRPDAAVLVARSGPVAYAALPIAGAPVAAALLAGPRPRGSLRALGWLAGLVLVAASLSFHSSAPQPFVARAPVPDWRTNPEEPYPFTTPVPALVATRLDGTYDRPPTETYPGGERPHCTRCQPYPPDAGRSTLTLDRGRFRVDHVRPKYASGGHFAVSGRHVVFFNDPECADVRGVYRWQVDGGRLTLTRLFDPCGFDQRARDLTDAAWERSGALGARSGGQSAPPAPPDSRKRRRNC